MKDRGVIEILDKVRDHLLEQHEVIMESQKRLSKKLQESYEKEVVNQRKIQEIEDYIIKLNLEVI